MLEWKIVFDDLMIKVGAISINTDNPIEEAVEEIIKIIDKK